MFLFRKDISGADSQVRNWYITSERGVKSTQNNSILNAPPLSLQWFDKRGLFFSIRSCYITCQNKEQQKDKLLRVC